jgi:hypothetical protein
MASQEDVSLSATILIELTLLLTFVPGLLGGIVYGVSLYLKELDPKSENFPPRGKLSLGVFFFFQAMTGIGGALAALLVMLWAKQFPQSNREFLDGKSMLILMTTSFVAGYVANRLLPAVADSLNAQIAKLAEKADNASDAAAAAQQQSTETAKNVEQAQTATQQTALLASETLEANNYLADLEGGDTAKPEKTQALIDGLTDLVKAFPTNRTVNILLGRVYDEAAGDRQSAIAALSAFVDAKKAANDDQNAATADAYWNLADYYFFAKEGEPRTDPDMRSKGIEAMKQSLQRVPSYFDALMHDDDFAALRNAPEAAAMLAAAKSAYDAWLKTQPQSAANTQQPPAAPAAQAASAVASGDTVGARNG